MVNYIVADAKPLSTVDSEHFMKMVGCLNPRFEMFSRRTLASMVAKEFTAFKSELIALVAKVGTVCLTADAWSSNRRAYLGVTLHWLNDSTFARQSRPLALKRFLGSL